MNVRRFVRGENLVMGATSLALIGALVAGAARAEENPDKPSDPDASASTGCTGRVSSLRDITFTKDGELYQVTDINEADCAPIYDPASRRTLGQLAANDTVIACSFITDSPARLHVMTPTTLTGRYVVGDVNLSPAGLENVLDLHVPTCASQGVEDIGFVAGDTAVLTPSPSAS